MAYTRRLIRNDYLQRHTFSWKEIDVMELTVACLIRTGKILVSNSIDLQKKTNKANISPLWTEGASSKKVWWLWFYFELTDSIAHLHQRNARASKTKTLFFFFMPVKYNFRQNFWSDQTTRKKVKFAKKFLFEHIFKNKSWSEVS